MEPACHICLHVSSVGKIWPDRNFFRCKNSSDRGYSMDDTSETSAADFLCHSPYAGERCCGSIQHQHWASHASGSEWLVAISPVLHSNARCSFLGKKSMSRVSFLSQKIVHITFREDALCLNLVWHGDPLWRQCIDCCLIFGEKWATHISPPIMILFTCCFHRGITARKSMLLLCVWFDVRVYGSSAPS